MRRLHRALLAALLAAPVAPACADGQDIPRSQLGGVSQLVAGTRVEISYRRPVARGRALFGELVPFGRVWTPSADTSAVFRISAPLEVNGSVLPAGAYGLWTIPDATSWTVIFSRQPSVFHLRYPEGQDVLRVRAAPEQGEHVETLQFQFPLVDADSAVLQLRWGTTVVPLKLRARPRAGG